MNWFDKFLTDTTTKGRMLRTIVEIVLSWLVTYAAELIGFLHLPVEFQTALVGLLTAIFTYIISVMSEAKQKEAEG